MNERQVALINDSYSAVMPIADTAAQLFYHRLFELDPSVKPLFKSDMKEQGRKLMGLIGTAVVNARNPGALRDPLEKLAERHVKYGVKMEHFDTVGAALLWTLGSALGPKFSEETKEAWATLYGEIVKIMAPTFQRAPAVAPPVTRGAPMKAAPNNAPPKHAPRSFFSRLAFWR